MTQIIYQALLLAEYRDWAFDFWRKIILELKYPYGLA